MATSAWEFRDFGKVGAAARTIANQAVRLGYQVDFDRAATGTAYLTVSHPRWCECDDEDECDGGCVDRLIRVADHEANEARYEFRINRRPDFDVEVGFQASGVRRLAEWIEVDPSTIPYLRRVATIERQKEAEKERRRAERDAETARARRNEAARRDSLAAAIAARGEDDELVRRLRHHEDALAVVHGKARKRHKTRMREIEQDLLLQGATCEIEN